MENVNLYIYGNPNNTHVTQVENNNGERYEFVFIFSTYRGVPYESILSFLRFLGCNVTLQCETDVDIMDRPEAVRWKDYVNTKKVTQP